MKASLVVRQRSDTGARVFISTDGVLLGRNEDNDVVLDSPRVSRYHARVSWNGAVYRIEDLGSRNGTRLNGAIVEAPAALKDSDLIQVGDVVLVFEVQGQQTITMADAAAKSPDGLSHRESELLSLVAAGHSNHEIADLLVLSVRTVERHVSNIYAKTGTRNRAEATAYAIGQGMSPRTHAGEQS